MYARNFGKSCSCFAFSNCAASTAGAVPEATVVGCKTESGTQIAATASYRFALRIVMAEKMYTPAEVRKKHLKHGEVMLRGSMSMGGMSMGGSMRHLEVQICAKKTGAVITNANPTIVVVDNTAKMTTRVPIAVMEGIGEGVADLHYGNNVVMSVGHRYTITVTLRGERVVFRVRLPKTV